MSRRGASFQGDRRRAEEGRNRHVVGPLGPLDRVGGNHGRRWVAVGHGVVVEGASGAVEGVADVVGEEGRHRGRGERLEHDRARRGDRLLLEMGLASVDRLAWGTQQAEADSSLLL